MTGKCPEERLIEDALLPKDNRHGTEGCGKSCREQGCLNDRIRWRQIAASSIAREEQIDAERDCCYRSRLLEQEGRAQQHTRWKKFETRTRRTTAERDCPRPDDREIHQHFAVE